MYCRIANLWKSLLGRWQFPWPSGRSLALQLITPEGTSMMSCESQANLRGSSIDWDLEREAMDL